MQVRRCRYGITKDIRRLHSSHEMQVEMFQVDCAEKMEVKTIFKEAAISHAEASESLRTVC